VLHIYIYIHTHTHTHTHIYIYTYIYIYIYDISSLRINVNITGVKPPPLIEIANDNVTRRCRWWIWDDSTLYVTFPFRRGTSPFSKICSRVIKTEMFTLTRTSPSRLQFRSVAVAERECVTWRNGCGQVYTCSIPIMGTVLRLLHYTSECFACKECCLFLSSEMDEKLIYLMWKREELYDMSNKKYSDSVWKEN